MTTLRRCRIQIDADEDDILTDALRDDSQGTWSAGIMGLYLTEDQFTALGTDFLAADLIERVTIDGQNLIDISAIVTWEV